MADEDSNPFNPSETPTIGPGTILGSYRVDKLIGRGGMSEVWRAVNEVTGQVVALKAIHIFFGSQDDRQAVIHREAALSSIKHSAIVQYYELIKADSGQLVLAMEFLEGVSLESACKHTQLDEADAASLLRCLAGPFQMWG